MLPDPRGDDTSLLPAYYRTTVPHIDTQFPDTTLARLDTTHSIMSFIGGSRVGYWRNLLGDNDIWISSVQHLEMDCVIVEEMCNHSIEKEISII